MRAYSESSQEALRARDLLKDWAGEGLLTQAQYQRMEQETVCDLRRTNIFLRLVLFFFTLIIVGAAVVLFGVVFRPAGQLSSFLLLVFAAISYAAAEIAVSQARLYRYGIEEALAACSVGLLCAGVLEANRHGAESLPPAAGVIASLWIWRRFGLPYALPAAMFFVVWLAENWTPFNSTRHLIVAAFYAAGLAAVAAARSRHRFTCLDDGYSFAEAFLWLGTYLAINLQLTSGSLFGYWWSYARTGNGFSQPFYWTTW
ncbi:MAG TPA: hypothetical protein VN893_20720, partial [Bryobacteraceae bacterium]|nr:hypothetical protein [Bryobacteraceae bacterium]